MKTFRVTIAVEEFRNYDIEAESEKEALKIWEERGFDLDVNSYDYGDQIGETIIEEF